MFNDGVVLGIFSTGRNIFYGGNHRKNGDRCLRILIVSTNIITVLSACAERTMATDSTTDKWSRGWQRLMLKKCRASRRSCRLIIDPKSSWRLASTSCPQLRVKTRFLHDDDFQWCSKFHSNAWFYSITDKGQTMKIIDDKKWHDETGGMYAAFGKLRI